MFALDYKWHFDVRIWLSFALSQKRDKYFQVQCHSPSNALFSYINELLQLKAVYGCLCVPSKFSENYA